jgi:hypothetical protein
MARYADAFRNRVVAGLLPPESADIGALSREVGFRCRHWNVGEIKCRPCPPEGGHGLRAPGLRR